MTFQLRVRLALIGDPAVWRRLLVPSDFTFFRLHQVIQAAFGWKDYHQFIFLPKGWGSLPKIGIPNKELGFPVQDCKKATLDEIFNKPKQTFSYIYDFGGLKWISPKTAMAYWCM